MVTEAGEKELPLYVTVADIAGPVVMVVSAETVAEVPLSLAFGAAP